MGSWGFRHLNPWGRGKDLDYFLLGGDTFALMTEMVQQKPTHKERDNSKLQDLQRQEGSGECIGILVSRFRVLLGTME